MHIRLSAALVVGALSAPGVAVAAPTWHTHLQVAPFGTAPGDPGAVLGPGGDALAAWSVSTTAGLRPRVQVRTRAGFTQPWSVRWTSPVLPTRPSGVVVARGAGGSAVVAWRSPAGGVTSAVRDGTHGGWRLLTVATGAGTTDPDDLRVPVAAVAADGTARLAWVSTEAGTTVVRTAERPPGGTWTPTGALDVPVAPQRVAIDAAGDAVAVWVIPAPGTEQRIVPTGAVVAARRAAGAGWGPSEPLGDTVAGADAALDATGTATIAWSAGGATGPRIVVARAARGAAAVGAPTSVAAGIIPRVAVGESGTVTALAWTDADAGFRAPLRAAVDSGAGWTTPQQLWDSSSFGTVEVNATRVAVAPDGRVVVGWLDPEGPGSATVVLRSAGADGVFRGIEQAVGTDEDGFVIAPGPDDAALVLTPAEVARSGGHTIFAASYDAAPRPALRATVHGRRLAGTRRTAWTVTVRNRGAATATGVLLTLNSGCCGNRVVSAVPAGRAMPPTRNIRWALGTIRVGAARTVRITTLAGVRTRPPYLLIGTLAAVAVPVGTVTGRSAPVAAAVTPAG